MTRRLPQFQRIEVNDPSQASEARRASASMADVLQFDEVKRGQVELIATELARNAAIHGGGGHLYLTGWQFARSARIDIVAVDSGRGIKDISKALEDGVSTAGTPGTGMGAVSRLSSNFEVFSQETGTSVLAQVSHPKVEEDAVSIGAISIPIKGERVCGDAFATSFAPERSIFMVVDGLGHGILANEAAEEALAVFDRWKQTSPGDLIQRIHDALKKTRGAAVAVAEIMPERETVTYAGVGNISGVVVSADGEQSRSMVSHNGIVGHQLVRNSEFNYPWPKGSTLVMHSDGLSSHWDLKSYPGLLRKSPAMMTALLYRDKAKRTDDVTVLIAQPRQGNATQ